MRCNVRGWMMVRNHVLVFSVGQIIIIIIIIIGVIRAVFCASALSLPSSATNSPCVRVCWVTRWRYATCRGGVQRGVLRVYGRVHESRNKGAQALDTEGGLWGRSTGGERREGGGEERRGWRKALF